jgi:hypothetical protein
MILRIQPHYYPTVSTSSCSQKRYIYHIVGLTSPFAVEPSPCTVLSNITSQLCPTSHRFYFRGLQNSASARETDVTFLAPNSDDAVTINVGTLVTTLHMIIIVNYQLGAQFPYFIQYVSYIPLHVSSTICSSSG